MVSYIGHFICDVTTHGVKLDVVFHPDGGTALGSSALECGLHRQHGDGPQQMIM
jgi:hypothetical protein